MTEHVVMVKEELVTELSEDCADCAIAEFTDNGERQCVRKAHVDYLKGEKIKVFSNEHLPPHFRVKFQGSTANYSIKDDVCISGGGEVTRYDKNTYRWWKKNKQKLIDIWNTRRPSDCPVGVYK